VVGGNGCVCFDLGANNLNSGNLKVDALGRSSEQGRASLKITSSFSLFF
jgi:hypothetical protein